MVASSRTRDRLRRKDAVRQMVQKLLVAVAHSWSDGKGRHIEVDGMDGLEEVVTVQDWWRPRERIVVAEGEWTAKDIQFGVRIEEKVVPVAGEDVS